MNTNAEQEFLWILHNWQDYRDFEIEGHVGKKAVQMTEKQAQEMNYARGVNQSPFRWIKRAAVSPYKK